MVTIIEYSKSLPIEVGLNKDTSTIGPVSESLLETVYSDMYIHRANKPSKPICGCIIILKNYYL